MNQLVISGARVHNLKNVTVTLPKNQLIVFTGLSGSGKSSLAFDTIYAEGQRRYVESLSAYARQFLDKLEKPDVDTIEGLSPAISIDQKTASHNPRSTVGTITEIYDYLRLLFASIGIPICYVCGKPIQKQSVQEIFEQIMSWEPETSIMILAPLIQGKKGEHRQLIETLQKDGFSRYRLDGKICHTSDPVTMDKAKKHNLEIVVDRLKINTENKDRLFDSLETALKSSKGLVLIEKTDTNETVLFSENFTCPTCQINMGEISPRLFSFNAPYGACKNCNGLGDIYDFDPDLVVEDPSLPARLATQKCLNLDGTYYGERADRLARKYGFSLNTPYKNLTSDQQRVLLYGESETYFESHVIWEGIITNMRRRYYQTASEQMQTFLRGFMTAKACPECSGKRLNKEALAVKIQGLSIADMTGYTIKDLCHFFAAELILTEKEQLISKLILKEINERLSFLMHVGLTYLALDRKASTLSGGEYQRIRLATQIGSGLTGVLYILDEPSIGLHQRDNQRLIQTLTRLRDLGNTVIVVEHDEETIRLADYVLDIGPGAGKHGGEIIFSGTVPELLADKKSLTAQYLNGIKTIAVPNHRRTQANRFLEILGAKENNLKNINVKFPLGQLVCVTGVSGSGKSSLINHILYKSLMRHYYQSKDTPGKHDSIQGLEHIDKVITIDQSPIGRTPRSNPATYTQLFTPIRELFAQTRDAKIRGYAAGRFSFNVKGGRCESCEGDGLVKIEMHFLSDVYVTCEVCQGKRYNSQTLEVKYKGLTISDILGLSVDEALPIFENIPQIYSKLAVLNEVGLGYIHLGQSATTLSGGEAQRIKLAKELSKRSTGKTIYLLDEPTTGLHFEDIQKLLKVLNRLVDTGNTVIVIEHNLDVIKTADYIIDLGPEGGDAGGQLIATGTPEDVAKIPASYTGQFLKKLLH